MLDDIISLAGGVTYLVPNIPVASTLLASIVATSGVLYGIYVGQQTRQVADFVGALDAVKDELGDPVWLEIGPSQVCSSFIRATLSSPSGMIMSTLEASTNAWVFIFRCLAGAYNDGIAIDWLAHHAPFRGSLKLLTLPRYISQASTHERMLLAPKRSFSRRSSSRNRAAIAFRFHGRLLRNNPPTISAVAQ